MGKGIAGPAEKDYRIKQSASTIRMAFDLWYFDRNIKVYNYSQYANINVLMVIYRYINNGRPLQNVLSEELLIGTSFLVMYWNR